MDDRRSSCCLLQLLCLCLIGWIGWLVPAAGTAPASAPPPILRVLGVFSAADYPVMSRVFHKTLMALNKEARLGISRTHRSVTDQPWVNFALSSTSDSSLSSFFSSTSSSSSTSDVNQDALDSDATKWPERWQDSGGRNAIHAPGDDKEISRTGSRTVARSLLSFLESYRIVDSHLKVGAKNVKDRSLTAVSAPALASPVNTASGQHKWVKLEGMALAWKGATNQTMEDFCKTLSRLRPAVVLVLTDDDRATFSITAAAGATGVAVVGIKNRGLDDDSFRGIAPWFVGLNPRSSHLVAATKHLLAANKWTAVTAILDDSPRARRLYPYLAESDSDKAKAFSKGDGYSPFAWTNITIIHLKSEAPGRQVLARLSSLQSVPTLVILVCCDPQTAAKIFREAAKINMLDGDWIWIVLEEATETRSAPEAAAAYPLGLLGLRARPIKLSKYLMKGAVMMIDGALRTAANQVADLSQVALPLNGMVDPPPGCGPALVTPTRVQFSQHLVKALEWRVKEALSGRLTYDGGGKVDSALQAVFDVLNWAQRRPYSLQPSVFSFRASNNSPGGRRPRAVTTKLPLSVATRTFSPPDPTLSPSSPSASSVDTVSTVTGQIYSVEYVQDEPNGWDSIEDEEEAGTSDDGEDDEDLSILGGGAGADNTSVNNNGLSTTSSSSSRLGWKLVGNVTGSSVVFQSVVWPGDSLAGPRSHSARVYRVATMFSPPFVMEAEVETDQVRKCLTGIPCLQLRSSEKDEIARIFGDYERGVNPGVTYNVTCCYGLSIDLMENVANDLGLRFQLYVVADGQCGAKRGGSWDGIVADLRSGAAQLSFAPLSVTSSRAEVIDFSIPYFYSGLSFLQVTKHDDVPLLAFLTPFSPDLWIGIFVSLNMTALAVAIYEWLSPFGLNPWGRQRTKNFTLASALWVMWGLLFSHLVAFKAPKSWPNKFLINVWGGFSVIFLASYTANIAALFAGIFSQTTVTNFHDPSLLHRKVGTTRSSAADHYASKADRRLWEHMQKFTVSTLEEGVAKLKDGKLDLLIGDTPILDYYRGNDAGCTLRTIGDVINEDTYAVGLSKGLPLQASISAVLSRYASSGYLDELRSKWYSSLPCFHASSDAYKPQPLGVSAVAGVFILLGFGMLAGCLILILEHLVYKFALPGLRQKPKGTVWRSPNMMFFSQKLYRFINCVELLPPHHAAKELMNSLRQGQITSLFQKSVKRKENEQRRRRKSKAQFFEMIQEIRRFQREEREDGEDRDDGVKDGDEKGEEKRDEHHSNKEEELTGPKIGTIGTASETSRKMAVSPPPAPLLPPLPPSVLETNLDEVDLEVNMVDCPQLAGSPTFHHRYLSRAHSNATDPGTYASCEFLPPWTDGDSEVARPVRPVSRRTSVSLDMLQSRSRRNSLGSPDLSDSDLTSSTEESSTNRTISTAMVDKATMQRLTKEDVFLLWQAAETELEKELTKAKNAKAMLVLKLKQSREERTWRYSK